MKSVDLLLESVTLPSTVTVSVVRYVIPIILCIIFDNTCIILSYIRYCLGTSYYYGFFLFFLRH